MQVTLTPNDSPLPLYPWWEFRPAAAAPSGPRSLTVSAIRNDPWPVDTHLSVDVAVEPPQEVLRRGLEEPRQNPIKPHDDL